MSLDKFSVTDANEVRRDASGVATAYLRGIARMTSIDDNLTQLQIGLSSYQRFQPHPTESSLYVSEFQAVQKPHTHFWDVQVTYTDAITADPRELPAVIGEIQTYTIPGARLVDHAGNAILNTAGEPPEPFDFPERVMQIPIIKNIDAVVPTWLWDFEDCVNDGDVTIDTGVVAPARTLLISSIKVSAVQTQGSFTYRTCTIEVLRRKSTWDVVFPSRGFNQLVSEKEIRSVPTSGSVTYTTVNRLSPIRIKGEVPTEAQFLDSAGKWIPHPSPSDVVLLTAQLQKAVDFATFPLT